MMKMSGAATFDINSGTLDDVVIGGTNANTGTFTVLTANTSLGVTGNITVSGTVDGRDVAADGTKLDGIESGATADQTASEILTAVKTVDGSGSGLDADTVDGVQASSFLRSDATDTVTGLITIDRTGEVLGIGDASVDSADAYVRMGNGTFDWQLKYVGSTSGTDGNEFRIESTNTGDYLQFDHDGNFQRYDGTSTYTIWDSGNDGSGSGLDADTTDGYQASESSTGSTLAARNSSGDLYMRYGVSAYLNMSHSSTTRSSDTVFYSSTDSYLRKNNATGFKTSLGLNSTDSPSFAGLNINGDLNAVDRVYIADALLHEGDTDTKIGFGTDTITLSTGGSSEITVNSTGVRLGDTGNGYFQPVTGNYGSIQIDGGSHSGYEGYSIGGVAVFMTDSSSYVGLYNDANNQWWMRGMYNGEASLYYAGTSKLQTTSTGVNIDGNLNAVDNVYVADRIYHEGDTDTYMQFHASNQWRVVTGGTEMLEVNDSNIQLGASIDVNGHNLDNVEDIYLRDKIYHDGDTDTYLGFAGNQISLVTGNTSTIINATGVFISNGSLAEDYDALSGTSPTCNVDNGGMFSLTMSGNTTFTFSGASSGYMQGFVLQLVGNGSTVTWPSSVDWAGGSAPDAPASGETDIYVFITRDGGTTWYGVQSIDAAA